MNDAISIGGTKLSNILKGTVAHIFRLSDYQKAQYKIIKHTGYYQPRAVPKYIPVFVLA